MHQISVKVRGIKLFPYQIKENVQSGLHNLPEILFKHAAFVLKSCVPVKFAVQPPCQCVHSRGYLGQKRVQIEQFRVEIYDSRGTQEGVFSQYW